MYIVMSQKVSNPRQPLYSRYHQFLLGTNRKVSPPLYDSTTGIDEQVNYNGPVSRRKPVMLQKSQQLLQNGHSNIRSKANQGKASSKN